MSRTEISTLNAFQRRASSRGIRLLDSEGIDMRSMLDRFHVQVERIDWWDDIRRWVPIRGHYHQKPRELYSFRG